MPNFFPKPTLTTTIPKPPVDVAIEPVKTAVQMQGQQLRAEHARVHAQVLGAIGNELVVNAAAAYQMLAGSRFSGSITNIELQKAMLKEVEHLVAEGLPSADAQALANTAFALHAEVEDKQNRVYDGAASMVDRVYEGATGTTKSIIANQ